MRLAWPARSRPEAGREETLMLRKVLVGSIIGIAAVIGSVGTGHAGVSVDLGIHLGAPAAFAPVPASPVLYAPTVNANLFSYDGDFYVFLGSRWYVGPAQTGPWTELPPEYIPRPILAVPVRYYHVPPREWTHWRREAPPRWAPAWGRRWEEHRHGPWDHRGYGHHRDDRHDRHVAYRDDHRDDRRGDWRDRDRYDRREDRR
jgi:hypothetical protein